ncbi:MAG: hypothetical protein V4717_19815 [Bacteroidota bacterium]
MIIQQTLLILCSVLLFSCQQINKETTGTETKTISTEDSLYHSVIGLHDEAMAKIGKMKGYQKSLELKIDSLEKQLVLQKNETTITLKKKYESLLTSLQQAEKGMNDWMDSFNPEPKLPSKTDLEKYWADQQQKTKKMRDAIFDALDSANKIIPK